MDKKIFGVYLAKQDAPDSEANVRLKLPASPWELHDAMDRVQLQENEELGVDLYVDSRVLEIKKNSVLIDGPDGKTEIMCDSVVIAAGAKPNVELAEKLSDLTIPMVSIGDAVSVGKISGAIRSAYKLVVDL